MKIETNELSKNSKGGTELMVEGLASRLDPSLLEQFQIIPSRVREIDSSRKQILWLHDLPQDPEAEHLKDPASRDRFAGLVLPSNWSMQMYNLTLGLPYAKATVLQNAIDPLVINDDIEADRTIRLIYHTTPHRGLQILIPVFEHLYEIFDSQDISIHLDVYSSFAIYGWENRDAPFAELFERCRNHPGISYHGAVPNSEVREALSHSDIFAYPSIWPETSCIAAIEALSAKCLVVCPNYAALPETCSNWAMMYQFSENQQEHANRFASTLANGIVSVNAAKLGKDNGEMARWMHVQKTYIDTYYNWNFRVHQWETYLRGLSTG